jgi:ParB family chromosome partitioning protein
MPADAPHVLALPLDAIEATALIRDRTGLDPAPFDTLKRSILATGVQSPVTVFALPDAPAGGPAYGLIAGYRRLFAVRTLQEDGFDGFDTIPALVHPVSDKADAYRLMVEENAVRTDVSVWETARLTWIAVRNDLFPTIEAAIERLHAAESRFKRVRLRRIAMLVEEFDGLLAAPETLSLRQLLRLAAAVEAGFLDPILLALEATAKAPAERQWAAIAPFLAENEATPPDAAPRRPGRPRRALRLRRTLTVRRERTRDGYVLRFSGPEATSPLLDEVLDQLEQIYTPQ